jgi:hypothetical protein
LDIADLDALFAALHPPLKGVVKFVYCDGSSEPLLACLEAVLGQQEVSQLQLHSWNFKKVRSGEI